MGTMVRVEKENLYVAECLIDHHAGQSVDIEHVDEGGVEVVKVWLYTGSLHHQVL